MRTLRWAWDWAVRLLTWVLFAYVVVVTAALFVSWVVGPVLWLAGVGK